MQTLDSLRQIRSAWVIKLAQDFARGEVIRDSFVEELNVFFDSIILAVAEANTEEVTHLLANWSNSLTESDFGQNEGTLVTICNRLFETMYEIARGLFNDQDTLALLITMLPVHTEVIISAGRLEKEKEIEQIKHELNHVREQMNRLDKSKSDFISIAAHELKTPLTLIDGYATMLREAVDLDINRGVVNQMLHGMDQGARRLRKIIEDMIDVSLIDNDLLTLNFQPVWIGQLIEILKNEFAEAVRERNQTMIINSFEGSKDMIFADPERIIQAFSNVLSNAVKYTPDGGMIQIDGRKLPGFLEITISDTGIGIDIDDQLRIFEKFNRIGDASRHSSGKIKYKGGGPGLGLPISKGIIEAHGGTLWVESDGYDESTFPGSVFHLLLPLRREPPDARIKELFGSIIDHNHAID